MTIKSEGTGDIELAGAAIGTAENIAHFSDIVGLIMFQNNSTTESITFPDLSSENAIQALTYYTLFAQPPTNVWDATQEGSVMAFAGGKVAFMFGPSWEIFVLQELNPDLIFGVAPVPQVSGARQVAWGSFWAEGVSSASRHQVAAHAFLKYLSSRDALTKLYAESSKTRLFGNPYPRKDLAEEMKNNNFLAPIAEQAPYMKSWYMASNTQGEGINSQISAYFRNAVNAIYVGSSAEGELGKVKKGVADVLGEYGY
jgi:multiple sugar transport system substrate-binding protein